MFPIQGGQPAARVYIEDVFSTWLYTGNGSTQTINNGIDLATKGGLVWNKNRTTAGYDHVLFDTATSGTGASTKWLASNSTNSFSNYTGNLLASYNNNGFTFSGTGGGYANNNGEPAVSWTFAKQPKFFDVVTYTGNGSNRTIAHNLGSVPGCIFIKRTDTAADWQVYHRDLANTEYLVLNSTAAKATGATRWNSTTPTASVFSLGTDTTVNASGGTYVAYIFAHNASGFGLSGTENVISCGSFVTNSSGQIAGGVNLGWEPQFVLIKTSSAADNWTMFDSMRGFTYNASSNARELYPNLSNAESSNSSIVPTSTGFTTISNALAASQTYIYIAIRRGPMRVPTDATRVFAPVTYSGTSANRTVGIGSLPYVDSVWVGCRNNADNPVVGDRLRGSKALYTSQTFAESTSDFFAFDLMEAMRYPTAESNTNVTGSNYIQWAMRRAPGFFDEVCYTGDSTLGRAVPHNLGSVPELMIVKNRNNTENWVVYSAATGNSNRMILNSTAASSARAIWANTTPTSTNFYVGGSGVLGETNFSTYTYVAYLFATCAGVSKVGSYTGTGTTLAINCGFTGGARFVLIKRTDSTGDWYIWDSARGIVAGNDPYMLLNAVATEVTTTDWVDTLSTGFELSNAGGNNVNINGGTYIYLAIA